MHPTVSSHLKFSRRHIAAAALLSLWILCALPPPATADQGGIAPALPSGTYAGVLQVAQYGSCSLGGGEDRVTRSFTVEVRSDAEGFAFEVEGTKVEAVYSVEAVWEGLNTARVTVAKVSSCKGFLERHEVITTATVDGGTLLIEEYVMPWCPRMGCLFREAWTLFPEEP